MHCVPFAAVRQLEETEVEMILKSDDFQRFFDKTSRIVERILFEEEEDNPFVDYTGTDSEKKDRSVSRKHRQCVVCQYSTKIKWHHYKGRGSSTGSLPLEDMNPN